MRREETGGAILADMHGARVNSVEKSCRGPGLSPTLDMASKWLCCTSCTAVRSRRGHKCRRGDRPVALPRVQVEVLHRLFARLKTTVRSLVLSRGRPGGAGDRVLQQHQHQLAQGVNGRHESRGCALAVHYSGLAGGPFLMGAIWRFFVCLDSSFPPACEDVF